MEIRTTKRYGWRPDLPDYRDWAYANTHYKDWAYSNRHLLGAVVAPIDTSPEHAVIHTSNGPVVVPEPDAVITVLPEAISMRSKMPPVWNQGQLGSCTAMAASALFQYAHGDGPYSVLHIYYYERLLEGTVNIDSGAQIRDAIQVLANTGVGLDKDWPYVISNFAVQPPLIELMEATQNKAISYSRLEPSEYRLCLAQGHPFIIGITVYSSFETPEVAVSGIVPMPQAGDKMMGGHAVCVVGYNNNINGKKYYEVRNSWGETWGDQGYFWIPAEYLENPNLATDAWTIRK